MPHTATGRGGATGDKADDRLAELPLDVLGSFLLGRAADLADHHHCVGLLVLLEQSQRIDKAGADYRIASDADAGRLTDSPLGELPHGLVGKGAAARDHADSARLVDEARHNADFALARRDDPGAVGTDQAGGTGLQIVIDLHHIGGGNPLGDADHQLCAGVRSFHNSVSGKGRGHKNHRNTCSSRRHRIGHRVENRQTFELLPPFTRGHPSHHLSAILHHLPGVEGTLPAGDSLHDYLGAFVDQNAHVTLSSILTDGGHDLFGRIFQTVTNRKIQPRVLQHPSRYIRVGTGQAHHDR